MFEFIITQLVKGFMVSQRTFLAGQVGIGIILSAMITASRNEGGVGPFVKSPGGKVGVGQYRPLSAEILQSLEAKREELT